MIRISEMEMKKIINTVDGRILGSVCDFDLDTNGGRINAVLLPSRRKEGLFRKKEAVTIPWPQIKKIGVDVILAEAPQINDPDSLPGHSIR